MRIMLISSVVTHSAQSNPEWTAENDVGDFPPMGLIYLAGYLRAQAPHHQIRIVDANVLRYTQEDIERELIEFRPDVVGMTMYTDILYDILQTLRMVKRVSGDIKIVVGGAHPINHPQETMAIPEVDFICIGEGEIIFAQLIEALEGRRDLSTINGLIYRDRQGGIVRNEGAGYIEDLDSLPYPAFDLLPYKKYFSMIGTGVPMGVLCSSRGCPYKCTFCSKMYNNYRGRSAENIIGEMRLYYECGIREFMFFDDMFNFPARRAIEIARNIAENFKDIEWSFRGRADQITEELGEELRKSNCKQISLGAEAHADKILTELRTGKKIEYIKKAVQISRKSKIRVNTNWIIGLPQYKSAQDIREMMKTIFEIDPDYVQFTMLMLWDDTELYRQAVERRIVDPRLWTDFINNPAPQFLIPCWEEHLSRKEQSVLLRECYTRFYLRPKTAIRQIMDVRSWTMFKLKFKGLIIMLIPLFYPVIRFFNRNLSRRKDIHKL